jgi:prepilin-type processing-associated H-X9-DG protein
MRKWLIVIFAILIGIVVFDHSVLGTCVIEPHELVFDCFSLLLPFFAFSSLVIHALALLRYRKTPDRATVRNNVLHLFAVLLVGAGVLLPAIAYVNKHNSPSFCANHLKYLKLIFDFYATENNGLFPPIDDVRNNFMFDGNAVYPEYLTDVDMLACPQDPEFDPKRNFRLSSNSPAGVKAGAFHPDCITDMSYCYLGWIITNQQEAEAFFEAYDKMSQVDYDQDIIVPEGRGNGGANIIYRLRSADELLPNLNIDLAKVPVLWDKPSNDLNNFSHVPTGSNVLYLDGHIEFVRFGERFPIDKTMARLLDERPRAPIADFEE